MHFMVAIKNRYGLLVRDMLIRGADVNMRIGDRGDTVLGMAIRQGCLKVVRMLLEGKRVEDE